MAPCACSSAQLKGPHFAREVSFVACTIRSQDKFLTDVDKLKIIKLLPPPAVLLHDFTQKNCSGN